MLLFGSCFSVCSGKILLGEQRQQRAIARELTVIEQALERRYARSGFPADGGSWEGVLVEEKFLEAWPADSWGRPFLLEVDGLTVSVRTLGKDGMAGGMSDDADQERRFLLAPRP